MLFDLIKIKRFEIQSTSKILNKLRVTSQKTRRPQTVSSLTTNERNAHHQSNTKRYTKIEQRVDFMVD